jgi:hypothetical protein
MTKTERFADNRRRAKIANKEADRRQKILHDYLNSPTVKKLQKDVDEAIDAVNVLVHEWNDIVLEDNPHFKDEIATRRKQKEVNA